MTSGTHWAEAHRLFLNERGISGAQQAVMQAALERFLTKAHGEHDGLFPDRKVENWKYTSLAHLEDMEVTAESRNAPWHALVLDNALAGALLRLGLQPDLVGNDLAQTGAPAPIVIVHAGGRLVRSNIPQVWRGSVSVSEVPSHGGGPRSQPSAKSTASASVAHDGSRARGSSRSDLWGSALTSLHDAFCDTVLKIELGRVASGTAPTILLVDVHHPEWSRGSLGTADTELVLAPGAVARLVVVQSDPRPQETLQLAGLDVQLGAGASLGLLALQDTLEGQHLITNTTARCARQASFRSLTVSRGRGVIRNHLDCRLEEPEASCSLSGSVHPRPQGSTDNLTHIQHLSGNTTSEQLYKQLVDDTSHAVFRGMITIAKGADASAAHQTSRSILLGPQAQADAKPELNIAADDVSCSHGATVGPLREDEVFYLQSRGLDRQAATALLCKGFLDEAGQRHGDPEFLAWAQRWQAARDTLASEGAAHDR